MSLIASRRKIELEKTTNSTICIQAGDEPHHVDIFFTQLLILASQVFLRIEHITEFWIIE